MLIIVHTEALVFVVVVVMEKRVVVCFFCRIIHTIIAGKIRISGERLAEVRLFIEQILVCAGSQGLLLYSVHRWVTALVDWKIVRKRQVQASAGQLQIKHGIHLRVCSPGQGFWEFFSGGFAGFSESAPARAVLAGACLAAQILEEIRGAELLLLLLHEEDGPHSDVLASGLSGEQQLLVSEQLVDDLGLQVLAVFGRPLDQDGVEPLLELGDLFAHHRVPVVLDRIVCAAGEVEGDLGPLVAHDLVALASAETYQEEDPLLLDRPGGLLDARTQVVVPSLSALLAFAAGHLASHFGPLLVAERVHELPELVVLFCRPRLCVKRGYSS